jgi:CubicO group peptidase (beta-lactamase class C family)
MCKSFQTFFFFIILTQICLAQCLPPNPLFPVGSVNTSVDSMIQSYMLTNRIPGLAACVVKDERIIWESYYGLGNISHQDSVKSSTIFMLASVSKPIVGAALMKLWQNGRFQLDDSVNAYLPFSVRNPYFPASVITFRQLMSHVSSIRDNWNKMPEYFGDPPLVLGTYLREYLTPGGTFYSSSNFNSSHPPASIYEYTNIGAALCAYLVETISGIMFDQYCRDSIFLPLGMTNTAWFLRDLDTTLIARPYTWNGNYIDLGLRGYSYYPSAQLRTTLRSLAQFLALNICYGKVGDVRILDSATVSVMRKSHYPSIEPTQGLIWYTYLLGQRLAWGHAGIMDGVRAAIWLDENKRTGIIVLANMVPTTSIIPILNALFEIGDTITVGIDDKFSGNHLPFQYYLSPNYPNPFNPGTKIKYSVPQSSNVILKIFDVLGNEIETLVNQEKPSGTYEVTWNATNLPSGVYFYRIQSGPSTGSGQVFIETKKMILLK